MMNGFSAVHKAHLPVHASVRTACILRMHKIVLTACILRMHAHVLTACILRMHTRVLTASILRMQTRKVSFIRIDGHTPTEKRHGLVDQFQSESMNVAVALVRHAGRQCEPCIARRSGSRGMWRCSPTDDDAQALFPFSYLSPPCAILSPLPSPRLLPPPLLSSPSPQLAWASA